MKTLISFPVSRLDYSVNQIKESSNLIPFVSCLQPFLSLIFTIYTISSVVKLPKEGKDAQSSWAGSLQGQREKQRGLVMQLTVYGPEKNISCPPLSFSRLISLHLSIHLTKMLFHSKKARNIPQFPQNITLPSNKNYFAFVWRGFLPTFSSAFREYTTVFIDFFHTEEICLSNPTKFSGLLVLVSLKPHLSFLISGKYFFF